MANDQSWESASLELSLRNKIYEVLEKDGRPCSVWRLYGMLFGDVRAAIRNSLDELRKSGLVAVTDSGGYIALPRDTRLSTAAPEVEAAPEAAARAAQPLAVRVPEVGSRAMQPTERAERETLSGSNGAIDAHDNDESSSVAQIATNYQTEARLSDISLSMTVNTDSGEPLTSVPEASPSFSDEEAEHRHDSVSAGEATTPVEAEPSGPNWKQVADAMSAVEPELVSELGHFTFRKDDGTAVFLELPSEECTSLSRIQSSYCGILLLQSIEQVFGPRRVEVRSGRYRRAFKTPGWSLTALTQTIADSMRSEERDAEIPTPGTAPAQELTHEIVSIQEETPGTAPVQGATSGVTSAQDEVSHSASGRASDLRPNNAGAKTASNPPTVEEWISTLDDDRAEILTCLFSGGRVATLAKARDISLTEARKLKKDALTGRPVLFEDRYRYLFRTYRMSSVTLKQLTGLGRLSYGYLMFLYSPGDRPLRPDALQDICVPQEIRDKLSEKNEETRHTPLGMVRVDGEYISRNRTSLLIKYGKQYAAKPMGASSFRLGYNEFLSRLSLGMGPDMSLPSSLAGFTYCLERTGSYLVISKDYVRYRPYSEYDYRALRELLGTYVSRNIECSTELLFREHPDLMKDLDILDAQELHVVIKRLLDEEDIEGVHLEKRPVIRFGEGDRKRQAIELIKEMGPSSVDEVAAEYESRFGNSPSFFKTAVKREISAYCKNGRFEYRETDMSAEQREYLLSLLDKDYQALDLVKAQFSVRFPDMNELDVNDEVLSELGYHVDCGLVVRDGVELGPVFSRLVRQRESFSIRDPDFGPAVLSHPEFRKVLNRGLNSLEIVEISKDEFVLVKKLKRIFGVTRADLLDYANEAGKTAQREAPFTIHSLRKEGFVHRIDSLREDAGLGDCMYESLIALLPQSYGIKRTAMGGTMVFCKLNHKFSAVDFLELVVKSEERIELDELIDLLLDEYGVSVPESTLRLAIDRAVGEGRLFFNQSFQMLLPSKEANLEFLRGLIDQPKQDQQ